MKQLLVLGLFFPFSLLSMNNDIALHRAAIILGHLCTLEDNSMRENSWADINFCSSEKSDNNYLNFAYGKVMEKDPDESEDSSLGLEYREVILEELFHPNDDPLLTIKLYKNADDDNDFISILYYQGNEIGSCEFYIQKDKDNQISIGHISILHLSKKFRKKCYGSYLLAFSAKKIFEYGCKKIIGKAQAFDLKHDEEVDSMQQKLVNFYTSFGAKENHQGEMEFSLTE